MSSDSDDDFSYTNTASMLKALKKDISLSEEKNRSLELNEDVSSEMMLDKLDDKDDSIEMAPSKVDILYVNENILDETPKNDSCVIISDEDLHSSPANLISTIDKILVNGKRNSPRSKRTRSNIATKNGIGKGKGGRKNSSNPTTVNRRSKRISNKNEVLNKSTSIAIYDKSNICIIDDDHNDLQEINYEVDVKVLWMSQYLKKFSMRRFDKMEIIFKYFSEREKISESKLIFTIEKDAVILSKNDTPDSLNINAATIIEGGLRTENNQSNVISKQDKDCVEIKVQLKDRKRPLAITIRKKDRMEILMHKTAVELNVNVKSLKFYFDGDLIKSKDTVNDLQLEDGECIDCIKYK